MMARNDGSSTGSTANESCETDKTESLGESVDQLPAVRHSCMLRESRSSDPTVLSSCMPSTGARDPGQQHVDRSVDNGGQKTNVGGGPECIESESEEGEAVESSDIADEKGRALHSSNSTGNDATEEMALGRLLVTIGVLALALFIAAIDQTIVATATVKISSDFDSLSLAPWLANAYLLSSTALQPSTGKLSDILGRTPMLLGGIGVFAVGSLVCALAQSMAVLLVGRAVAGVGSAAIIGLTLVIVADIVPLRKRGPYMAVFSLVFSVSSVIGPLLGGVFADNVSWRWIFWLSEPVCGFVAVAIVFLLRKRLPATGGADAWGRIKRIDWLGVVLLVGGLVAFLMGLTLPSMGHSWRAPRVVLCLVFGGVIIGVFFLVEWRVARDPVVPLRLFRNRNVASMMAASFFMGACLFTPIYYVPIYYSVVENTSSTAAGIYLLPFVLGIALTSVASGLLVMRLGIYRPFMWAGTAVCTVGLGLLGLLHRDSSMAARICFLLVAGLGIGAFIQLSLVAGQAAVAPADMAATTAVLTFFRSVGSVVGMAAMQTIMNTTLRAAVGPIQRRFGQYAFVVALALDRPGVIYSPAVPDVVRDAVVDAYMHSLHLVFAAMVPFGALMFASALFLEHRPLSRRLPPAVAE